MIVTGDFNVCHEPIDIHNPIISEGSPGYTFYERSSLTKTLKTIGLVDSYRKLHPETRNYTWWSSRGVKMRQRNLGRRLDYIFMDERASGKKEV